VVDDQDEGGSRDVEGGLAIFHDGLVKDSLPDCWRVRRGEEGGGRREELKRGDGGGKRRKREGEGGR
jgi:hypothetical protein